MYNHPLLTDIPLPLQFDPELYAWLGDSFSKFAKRDFHEASQPFRLRISNLGKDTRQLWLESQYQRKQADFKFINKMFTGTVQELVYLYYLYLSGVPVQDSGEVELEIGGITIQGSWDILYDGKEMWDVKTASDYAYKNKFIDFASLSTDDPFGYIYQMVGYVEGERKKGNDVIPGGWVVFNKSNGEYKLVHWPKDEELYQRIKNRFYRDVEYKIKVIKGELPPPPCPGAVPETFYQKPTGNMKMNDACRWCSHPEKCHPTKRVVFEPSRVSKAKNPPIVGYIDEC